MGRQFTVTGSGITVIDLGVFDLNGDGLVASHDVTLFKINSGAGAANANVSAITGGSINIASGTGASLESSFRFQSLVNPIYLAPGDYSVVAYGLSKTPGGDPYGEGGQLPTGGNVSNIAFTPFQYTSASSPAYPNSGDNNTALSSASFRYNLGNTTTTPEPGTILGLVTVGALGALSRQRKQ